MLPSTSSEPERSGSGNSEGSPASRSPLAVLSYREFRLLWSGQFLSMIGSRMQGAAILWHVYDLTHSAFALGAIGLVRAAALMTFALAGGVLADAIDRRRLMLITQSVLALLAAGLGIWSLIGLRHAWPIYVVTAMSAVAMAFDNPARQSMLPTLVPRDRLSNAVSLSSASMQTASIAGPALMGLVIARHSPGMVYCINAVSFLAVILALLAMRPQPSPAREAMPRISLHAAIEGLRFMRSSRLLLSLMLLDFLATFFASADTMLPMFARRALNIGAQAYGLLAAAPAAGALLTGVLLAVLPPIRRQGKVVLGAVLLYGAATVAFGLARHYWLCFFFFAVTGAADTVSTVLRQTIRQLRTPDYLRGRMTSVNMMFFMGGPQLGEMEAGAVAHWFGAPISIISGGVACIVTVFVMAFTAPQLRAYEERPGQVHPEPLLDEESADENAEE